MRMNRIYKAAPMIAIVALILFSSSVMVASQATDYTKIGVKVGDRADYSITSSGYDRLAISVTEVTGVFVNITYTNYWSNGTVVHVSTARGNVSSGGLAELLVCRGLQAGDLLYQGAAGLYFNNTLSMEIAGATRTVNEIILSGDQHIYYDQQTGIFAKMVHPGGSNYTMISTNMWGPIDPVVLILIGGGAAAVAIIAVAVVLIRRRGK